MRIRIAFSTVYAYGTPSKAIIQRLRLTPRPHDGQFVASWRIEMDADGRLRPGEDAFGNITHMLSAPGPIDTLRITVTGEVETTNTEGILRGTVERLPDQVYLRETPLTAADDAIRAYASRIARESGADDLAALHRLLVTINRDFAFDTQPTSTDTTAAEAFALGRGVCQDLAHVFIAAARTLGIPARYVSGHLLRNDGVTTQEASHAWAEAKVGGIGWVGFDPANGICPTEAHVRVGVALDYAGVAPIRGSRFGGGNERLDVSLSVTNAAHHTQ